jgi:hypothetical protein
MVEASEIVCVTDTLSAFASKNQNCDAPEGPHCFDVDDLDFPKWPLKGRMRRWAYRWDCCMNHTESFIVSADDVATSGELAPSLVS